MNTNKIKLLALSIACLAASPASAKIVNVLTPSLGEQQDGYKLQLGESLSAYGGNVEKYKLQARFGARMQWQTHNLMLMGSAAYGKALGTVNTQNAFIHLRYRWAFWKNTKLLSFVQLSHNRFRLLNWRLLYGLGLEQQALRNDRARVDMGAVLMPEYELLEPEAVGQQGFTLRASFFIGQTYKLLDRLILSNTTFWQPALSQADDYRLLNDFKLIFPISKYFSVKSSVNVLYDSTPPEGIVPFDWTLSQGISVHYDGLFDQDDSDNDKIKKVK